MCLIDMPAGVFDFERLFVFDSIPFLPELTAKGLLYSVYSNA